MSLMNNDLVKFLDKMEKKHPVLFQHQYSYFLARASQRVEEVGEENRVYMTFNVQDLRVQIHDPIYEGQLSFLKGEAYKRVQEELYFCVAILKIQDVIEYTKLDGG